MQKQDEAHVERLLREYVRRIASDGGERPFVVTDEFEEIFGALPREACSRAARGRRYRRVSVILI